MNNPFTIDNNNKNKFTYKEYISKILSANDSLFLFDYKNKFVPDKLYKYAILPSVPKDRKKYLTSLKEEKIWFSRKDILNDPFELQYSYIDFYSNEGKEFFANSVNNTGIFCLSKNPLNKLMWSHYAQAHKGYCIEYNVVNKDLIFPVEYRRTRPNFSELYNNFMSVKDILAERLLNSGYEENYPLEKAVFALAAMNNYKDACWDYEKEFRITSIKSDQKEGFLEMPTNLIMTKIICGINCSGPDKADLQSVCDHVNKKRLKEVVNNNKDIPAKWLSERFYKRNEDVKLYKVYYDDKLKLHKKHV
ncbi:DUF2971 domain-containing protein [Anaerocolumna sp. AGMB13020]|uniref:DUF2971 domain-containing protein n=1 Tax=Anaerocolumna sp. AGMB13020 TaxID=3081750 RepID=UPI002954F967|nr:DUF2971 domain-containing protein [Anaerocolumna sp. AGMB13020]WOO34907.1 DUF2971 domain-containing protein [Anaerocolumna sp. AGMB13020]